MRGRIKLSLSRIRKRSANAEDARLHKNGRQIDVALTISPTRDAKGRVTGAAQIARGVTERKQTEQALHESETRLKQVLATVADAVVLAGQDGRIAMVNRAAADMFGYESEAELTGQQLDVLMPAAEAARHGAYLSAARLQGSRVLGAKGRELVGQRKDGSEFPIELSVSTFSSGRERFYTAVLRDITQRKNAEMTLRDSARQAQELAATRQRLAAIVTSSADAIIAFNVHGRITDWNHAAETMFGYTAEEAVGRNADLLVAPLGEIPPGEGPRGAFDHALSGLPFRRDTRRVTKDGAIIDVSVTATQIKTPDGEVLGVSAVMRDIRERKRQEERLGFLVREMNHRAKNLLTVVQAMAQQTASNSPEEFVPRFGARLRALAANQDLLVRSDWTSVRLDELVRSQLATFEDKIGSDIQLNGPPLHISAKAAQTLGMALHELTTNAAKYGALANGDGQVAIDWRLEGEREKRIFTMTWREQGVENIAPPRKRGFGSLVISHIVKQSLDAAVDLDYSPPGVTWRMECPAKEVLHDERGV